MKKKKRIKSYQKDSRKEKEKEIVVRVEQSSQNYLTFILVFLIILLFGVIVFMMTNNEGNNATGAVIANTGMEIVEVQREHYVAEKDIEILLNTSREIVEEMRAANLSIFYVQDLLVEMEDEANDYNINYNKLLENAQLITQTREDALYVRDILLLKKNEIKDYEEITEYNASKAWELYNSAEEEFTSERYKNAKELLKQITPLLDQITVDQTRLQTRIFAQTNRLGEWFKQNIVGIVITILIVTFFIALSYRQLQLILLRRKINHLLIEEEVLAGLIKKAQKEYYQEKNITKNMYAMKLEMYSSRMEEIKILLPMLQKELQKKRKERAEEIIKRIDEEKKYPSKPEEKKESITAPLLSEIGRKAVSQIKRGKNIKYEKIKNAKEKKSKEKKEIKKKKKVQVEDQSKEVLDEQTEQLLNYIYYHKKKRKSLEEIKQSLKDEGWPNEFVDILVDHVNNQEHKQK